MCGILNMIISVKLPREDEVLLRTLKMFPIVIIILVLIIEAIIVNILERYSLI